MSAPAMFEPTHDNAVHTKVWNALNNHATSLQIGVILDECAALGREQRWEAMLTVLEFQIIGNEDADVATCNQMLARCTSKEVEILFLVLAQVMRHNQFMSDAFYPVLDRIGCISTWRHWQSLSFPEIKRSAAVTQYLEQLDTHPLMQYIIKREIVLEGEEREDSELWNKIQPLNGFITYTLFKNLRAAVEFVDRSKEDALTIRAHTRDALPAMPDELVRLILSHMSYQPEYHDGGPKPQLEDEPTAKRTKRHGNDDMDESQ